MFTFLRSEWPAVFEAASKAAETVHSDPRTACFYARRALELAVAWAYKYDAALKLPYQDKLSAMIHDPSFKQAAGEAVFSKAWVIVTLGNRAVHSHRAIPVDDALVAVRELFHVAFWLARTYGRATHPAPGLAFDASALPKAVPAPGQTAEQLQQLEAGLRARDEKLALLLADKTALDEELKRLRAEVAAAKQAAMAQPDTGASIRPRSPNGLPPRRNPHAELPAARHGVQYESGRLTLSRSARAATSPHFTRLEFLLAAYGY